VGSVQPHDSHRRALLTRLLRDVRRIATEVAPGSVVHGRLNSASSESRKARAAGPGGRPVLDSIGIRAIVGQRAQCYALMARLRTAFDTMTAEYDDYIEHPKPNGYRSLHAILVTHEGQPVEVQVRTREMHADAEHGPAAHHRYKQTQTQTDSS